MENASAKRRRIPVNVVRAISSARNTKHPPIKKACSSCRRSKLKCDGDRPCRRCAENHLDCEFAERSKDSITERFEALENDILQMQHKLDAVRTLWTDVVSANSDNQLYNIPTVSEPTYPSESDRLALEPEQSSHMRVESTTSASAMSPMVVTPGAAMMSVFRNTNWSEQSTATPARSLEGLPKRNMSGFELSLASPDDFVARGLITQEDAALWFDCFFRGCDRFVPAFSPDYDTYSSVRTRSALLFDTIVTFGSRGADGPMSPNCQRLQLLLRERISLQVLNQSPPSASLETVQTLLVHACYSNNGWLLSSTAMRLALEMNLPESLEQLLTRIMQRKAIGMNEVDAQEQELFRITRTFLALFNLEQILSLDGEKTPTITLTTPPRRLRLLCGHVLTSSNDLRLFAQIELNVMRVTLHNSLPVVSLAHDVEDVEWSVTRAVQGPVIDLELWRDEWMGLVSGQTWKGTAEEVNLTLLNLRIQYEWASMTLHLRALAASGIENIAVMTDAQRALTFAAKDAADRHLDLMLKRNPANTHKGNLSAQRNECSYLAGFRYAMDFVWAKCAFSVLLTLRLGILLQDPIDRLLQRTENARDLLNELEKVGGAGVRYYRILALIVEKCERALREMQETQRGESMAQVGDEHRGGLDLDHALSMARGKEDGSDASKDFATYVPQEFLFEWHFPGLNLCYAPLNWQDLFAEF